MQQASVQGAAPGAQQSSFAIEAHGLVKVFGQNRAVDGVDLSVPTGSIYALLGPNGAGKTTIINVLTTLMKPDGGSAKVFGHDVAHETQVVRQLISVTGQSAAVDERLSATENLTIFGMLLGLSKSRAGKRAAELLKQFALEDAANRTLDKFSGGMRRRLDLATRQLALACLLFFISGAFLLLVSDLFVFSWRYQIPADVTIVPAGVLGIATLARLVRARRQPASAGKGRSA